MNCTETGKEGNVPMYSKLPSQRSSNLSGLDTCLASLPRKHKEFRIYVREINGRKFISLGEWFRGKSGDWIPSRELSLTIRRHELDQFISLLCQAKKVMTEDG
jgi:hypothetical protein